MIKLFCLRFKAKKVVLFQEIHWVKLFLSLTHCIGECVSEYVFLISKNKQMSKNKNKNTKKAKETKEEKRISPENWLEK